VVCGKGFKPRRSDQRYCSSQGDYTCENKLRNAEREHNDLFVAALVRQDYGCVGCGAKRGEACRAQEPESKSGGLTVVRALRPLVVHPHKVGSGEPLTADDLAASCVAERSRLYIELATMQVDKELAAS